MSGNGIRMDTHSINVVIESMQRINDNTLAGLEMISHIIGEKMERWAKENKPWKDRTSQAKNKMSHHVNWERNKSTLIISMSHHVDYGVWLELVHEKRFSILDKAIDKHKDEFIREWKKILQR